MALCGVKQIVPSSACLACDVCCRYSDRNTAYVPYFLKKEAEGIQKDKEEFFCAGKLPDRKMPPVFSNGRYVCRFFLEGKNSCRIYPSRPFDCRLYPFMAAYDKDYRSIYLVIDKKCPYLAKRQGAKDVQEYIDYLTAVLESEEAVREINSNKNFIFDFQKDFTYIKKLEGLSKKICLSGHGLKRLSLGDKDLFDRHFYAEKPALSSFSFAALYVWTGVLNILWKKIGGSLCVFAGNNKDYFLLIPPGMRSLDGRALKESAEMVLSVNGEAGLPPKIENIPARMRDSLPGQGFEICGGSFEYVYDRPALVDLRGSGFKSKRSLCGYFTKAYRYNYRKLKEEDAFECLALYREWAKERTDKIKDDYYRVLIEDSYLAQKTALLNLDSLGLTGRVIEIDGKIRGYTLGFPLNEETFVILFETADLGVEGLAQFIFREFCRDLSVFRFINTLGDSGLENLKMVKDSYHPAEKVPLYTAAFTRRF